MDAHMNMPDPQAMASAWMSQLTDPSAWQTLFKLPEIDASPMTKMMSESKGLIQPETLEALRNDYMQKANVLWQDFLAAKTPALKDRRFAAPEWQSNPIAAF